MIAPRTHQMTYGRHKPLNFFRSMGPYSLLTNLRMSMPFVDLPNQRPLTRKKNGTAQSAIPSLNKVCINLFQSDAWAAEVLECMRITVIAATNDKTLIFLLNCLSTSILRVIVPPAAGTKNPSSTHQRIFSLYSISCAVRHISQYVHFPAHVQVETAKQVRPFLPLFTGLTFPIQPHILPPPFSNPPTPGNHNRQKDKEYQRVKEHLSVTVSVKTGLTC